MRSFGCKAMLLSLILVLNFALPCFAISPGEALADPALEARARSISTELRCLVCQNQSIDNSDAELAKDLRILVRERLTAGDSDQQIYDFLVARYGEFVLLKPRFETSTLLLWLTPALLLLSGGIAMWFHYRKTNNYKVLPELSDSEKERLAKLVS